MPASEARIRANQANSLRSTGPKTLEGKEKSRQNAFKHGLTGEGIVVPNDDAAEIERRSAEFIDEFRPETPSGEALARRAAILSVRLDRSVAHETASLAARVRQVHADFVPPEGADPSTIARLKAEAKALAYFDPSREANLARKYEAAAERGFYKAIKELRQSKTPARTINPQETAEIRRQALGSFFQYQQEEKRIEARTNLPEPRATTPAPRKPETPSLTPGPSHFDLPITIGRRC